QPHRDQPPRLPQRRVLRRPRRPARPEQPTSLNHSNSINSMRCSLHTLRLSAALAATLLALPAAFAADDADAPATPKLPFVSNNGFDVWRSTSKGDWPVDWAQGKGISWHREEGRAFLRLTQAEPGKLIMVYRDFDIPADVKA